jgi:hypothetical protein
MPSPAFLDQDPRPICHRWLMAHMLTMAALEIGYPITILVQMKSNNGLMHELTFLTSSISIAQRYVTLARMLTRTKEHA